MSHLLTDGRTVESRAVFCLSKIRNTVNCYENWGSKLSLQPRRWSFCGPWRLCLPLELWGRLCDQITGVDFLVVFLVALQKLFLTTISVSLPTKDNFFSAHPGCSWTNWARTGNAWRTASLIARCFFFFFWGFLKFQQIDNNGELQATHRPCAFEIHCSYVDTLPPHQEVLDIDHFDPHREQDQCFCYIINTLSACGMPRGFCFWWKLHTRREWLFEFLQLYPRMLWPLCMRCSKFLKMIHIMPFSLRDF